MHVDKVRSPRAVCTLQRLLDSANKRLHLETPISARVGMLKRFIRTSIFIQTLNALDLHFKCKRFESNTLLRPYVKSALNALQSTGTTKTERADDTNRHDVKGCQESRRIIGLPFGKICHGVLANNQIFKWNATN